MFHCLPVTGKVVPVTALVSEQQHSSKKSWSPLQLGAPGGSLRSKGMTAGGGWVKHVEAKRTGHSSPPPQLHPPLWKKF
jgi:hypothetical protein